MKYIFWINQCFPKTDYRQRFKQTKKPHLKLYSLVMFVVGMLMLPVLSNAQEYDFEAESAILSNGASVQNANSCSGGQQVENIGGSSNGSVTFLFDTDDAGDYDLTLAYCSADQRSIYISVNYAGRVEIKCAASGGWGIPAVVKIQVSLIEGQNSIVFDNKDGWSPNLDQISLIPSPVFNVDGKIESEEGALGGVLVQLNGERISSVETDENGSFQFEGLTSGKNYSITPVKKGLVFNPPYVSYAPLNEEKTDQNFEAITVCDDCEEELIFGTVGKLIYNTQIGTLSVLWDDTEIISNAHSVVYNGGTKLSSLDYTERSVSFEDITDDFGNGTKMTVQLSSVDKPAMQQIFYAYTDRDYFLTEVLISGDNVSSNYMAPLVTNQVKIEESGDNHFLSVPFDNDGFVRYKSNSLSSYTRATSSEVTAFYENESRNGLVVGSVEHTVWKTGIQAGGTGNKLSSFTVWGGYTDRNVTRDENQHGFISGDTIKSPKIFVGYFNDWRDGLDEFGKANAITEPRYIFDWNGPTPFGWNSWGAIQTSLSLDKAKAVVDFFAESLPDFRNGETAYIDLDSYWDNMISGGFEGDFSNLIAFVNYCKSKGLKPGIYWAPFVDWGKYDRKVEGSNYNYVATWTKVNGGYHDEDGARAMDPTHPATQERIKFLINKLILCGFEMIKIDFIGHAAVEADSFYDPEVTTGMQAFRKGMEYLVDQLDGKMLVYAAISPNLAAGRYVHTRRIACDAYGDIGSTEYTLNSNTYGWWQDQIYNYIDGDMLVLGNNSIEENRARLTSGVINGTLITADDFSTTGQWSERAKLLFQNNDVLDAARDGQAFRPVEGNSENSASEAFVKEKDGEYDVAVVNYGNAKTFDLDFDRLGIESVDYTVKELYSGKTINYQGRTVSIDIATHDAVILHFSKGFPDSVTDITDDKKILLYPNPTADKLYIRSKQSILSVQVNSMNGSLLRKYNKIGEKEVTIDLSGYINGLYLITVVGDNKESNFYKVVKIGSN